jgi:hypothetical protein
MIYKLIVFASLAAFGTAIPLSYLQDQIDDLKEQVDKLKAPSFERRAHAGVHAANTRFSIRWGTDTVYEIGQADSLRDCVLVAGDPASWGSIGATQHHKNNFARRAAPIIVRSVQAMEQYTHAHYYNQEDERRALAGESSIYIQTAIGRVTFVPIP